MGNYSMPGYFQTMPVAPGKAFRPSPENVAELKAIEADVHAKIKEMMEGSGGILCPLRWDEQHHLWLEDIVRMLGLSSVLVADSGLGTINSVVLTAHYMHSRELPVKGIIFNNYHPGNTMEEDNIAMCAQLTGLPVLAKVQPGDTELSMDAGALANLYDEVTMQ